MNHLVIEDLDFYQSELPTLEQVEGRGNIIKFDWDGFFDQSFQSDLISSYALGFLSAYGIAIGPKIISS
ncbi:MAG: hypothetical protein AAGF26_04715 [Cyanobacteria bacterium P01_G01_bin.49]